MDQKDRKILRIIQDDAGLSMHDLAERCAMSKTAVWRRVRAMEESGVIRKRGVELISTEVLYLNHILDYTRRGVFAGLSNQLLREFPESPEARRALSSG